MGKCTTFFVSKKSSSKKSDKLKIETVAYFFNSSVKSPPFKYKIPFLILCSCFLLIFPLVQRTNVYI